MNIQQLSGSARALNSPVDLFQSSKNQSIFTLFKSFAFAVVVRVVATAAARRAGRRIALVPTLVAAVALVALTAVFDNVMLTAGIDDYSRLHASGLAIGRAPVEDFSYPLAAAVLLPAVWELTRRRTRADHA